MSGTDKDKRRGGPRPASPDLVFALNHPLRRGILRLMLKRRETPVSPKMAAAALDRPLGNVAYHVRVLARKEAVTLAETRRVRGTTQHFYLLSDGLATSGWVRRALRASEGFD